jgi:hypothetical protein
MKKVTDTARSCLIPILFLFVVLLPTRLGADVSASGMLPTSTGHRKCFGLAGNTGVQHYDVFGGNLSNSWRPQQRTHTRPCQRQGINAPFSRWGSYWMSAAS